MPQDLQCDLCVKNMKHEAILFILENPVHPVQVFTTSVPSVIDTTDKKICINTCLRSCL